jgi:hypothetical protein
VVVAAAGVAADTDPMPPALRSALIVVMLALAGCAAANGPAPANRPYVMPMGNDGGSGGGSGGGMGM